MLERSKEYQAAIVAPGRRIGIRASVSVIDPDIQYLPSQSSPETPWSNSEQLHDKITELSTDYATLENGRWLLNGSQKLIPDRPEEVIGQVGYVSDAVGDDVGRFSSPVSVELRFRNVDVLQEVTIHFPNSETDGVPCDFNISFESNGEAFGELVTRNTQKYFTLKGFTIYNPDAIRIDITKWSLPYRRARIPEIIPGSYENWDGQLLADLSVRQSGDVSCMSLPYGTCQLVLDNHTKRFEPRKKDSLFRSIEDRQGIGIEIGVALPNGNLEYKKLGVFYQKSPGWNTSDNGITITWDLVDIVGLLSERLYVLPDVLPTTLEGWVASVVAVLGRNFEENYSVDPNYAGLSVTANSRADVENKTCGDILRWICQATGTWPRAAASTGFLAVEPLWSTGGKITLRDIESYPTMKANPDIAMLVFNLYDGKDTRITVAGTSASSGDSKTISNPFIHTKEQALTAARMILSTYGGNRIETVGRGDPAGEIGDVDTVWLDESSATTGRRIGQSFELENGFLAGCKSTFLQANGAVLFEESVLLTEDTTWTAPAGVTKLFVVIGQGGQGGARGQEGILQELEGAHISQESGQITQRGSYKSEQGQQGASGSGGKIWYGTININSGQKFAVHVGAGGAASDLYGTPGAVGEESTFGAYSSAAGSVYPVGYTDIANGNSYGRMGVLKPLAGTSDGGMGGEGGEGGVGGWSRASTTLASGRKLYYTYWDPKKAPGKGKEGSAGASGFVLVSWDKNEVTA